MTWVSLAERGRAKWPPRSKHVELAVRQSAATLTNSKQTAQSAKGMRGNTFEKLNTEFKIYISNQRRTFPSFIPHWLNAYNCFYGRFWIHTQHQKSRVPRKWEIFVAWTHLTKSKDDLWCPKWACGIIDIEAFLPSNNQTTLNRQHSTWKNKGRISSKADIFHRIHRRRIKKQGICISKDSSDAHRKHHLTAGFLPFRRPLPWWIPVEWEWSVPSNPLERNSELDLFTICMKD